MYDLENMNGPIIDPDSYKLLIDNIGRMADIYDSNEIIIKSKFILERILNLKNNIPVDKYYDEMVFDEYNEMCTRKELRPQEDMDYILEKFKAELNYYETQLQKIIEIQSKNPNPNLNLNKSVIKKEVPEIRLPENFTVKQLNVHFDPLLSLKQASLFLYYLREKGVIPNYNSSELGKLAVIFFARNNKNIRDEITAVYENRQNSGDLKALQKILKSLLDEINKDLKLAN
jgi:hypothetical protein